MDTRPKSWAVLTVVGDRPNTSSGLDKSLVAVVVELGLEVIDRRVLIEIVGRIDGFRATFGRSLAVAYVIEVVGVAVVSVNCGNSICQLTASVVAIGNSIGLIEGST